jgi:site-specific DNA-cytosine methylase
MQHHMGEALFREAYTLMIEKEMNPDDLQAMRDNFASRFPPVPMRDDAVGITEFAGGGFADEGLRMAGIPTVASVEAWKAANDVRRDNHGGEIIEGYIGTEQGQLHPDDLIERYADASQGKPIHYHASPPCQAFTNAQRRTGPAGKTAEEIHEDRLASFPMIGNVLYTVEQMMKHPDINLNSWSLENAKEVAKFIQDNPELLDKYVSPQFKRKVMSLLTDRPKLDAINFGVPTTRGRTFIGEGWDAEPTHHKATGKPIGGTLPSPSVLDFLPHLAREEEENKPHKRAFLDELIGRGQISPKVGDYLMQGFISQSGGINPGKGGSTWRNFNSKTAKKPGGPGTAFLHRKPLDSSTTGITHNVPSHMYNRSLTPEEVMMIQGARPDYDISSALSAPPYKKTSSKGNVKSIRAENQMIGNAVSPPVMQAIGRSAFGSNKQKTLLDDFR